MRSEMTSELDLHARACYHEAQRRLSARTIAELNRRRIAACTTDADGQRAHRFGWPLAAAFGGVCALAIGFSLWLPQGGTANAPPIFTVVASLEANDTWDTLDALDAINLTALDEDSEFFLWLASQDASLLAMG